jgi:phosphoribosylamine--glycine ligase
MRVMILGGGGREHALAWSVAKSPRVDRVLCVPGNGGTAALGENVAVSLDDQDALVKVARDHAVDFTVVGPEAPLCAGIVDRFEKEGLRIFGPTAAAARIEGDKAFAKGLMKSAGVPTAEGRVFTDLKQAKQYVGTRDTGVVVKAAGLAAGKGVSVCEDPAYGLLALEDMMEKRIFGAAGDKVVVEELLKGEELSVFALVDGQTIYVLETAQDHKRVGEGDTGPNTGGMGAYSPAPIATPELMAAVDREVLVPIVDAMRKEGCPYRGVLYVGLMITAAGPKVLEFNCRFGDPEVQALLLRLESDLADLLESVIDGRLADADVHWDPRPAVTVVMASGGYPGSYEKGKVIEGLDKAAEMQDVVVFHAGTKQLEGRIVTNGGRVLSVTALGADVADAKGRALQAAESIRFDGAFYRRDIADRAIPAAQRT